MIKQAILKASEQLGWQGKYGIALLALAVLFNSLSLQPLENEVALLHGRVDGAHSGGGKYGTGAGRQGERQEAGAFFNSLPNESEITDILGTIYATAEANGVQLKEASYHLENKDAPRIEYVMEFPMTGEYAQIRRFVFRILANYPAIALDQINFQRDRVGDATLKANVRMTLFLRP